MKHTIAFIALFFAVSADSLAQHDFLNGNTNQYDFYAPGYGYQGSMMRYRDTWQGFKPGEGYQGALQQNPDGSWHVIKPGKGYQGTIYPVR